jgi:alpha-glucosidase (family GH31 glycosyl hydrolase)
VRRPVGLFDGATEAPEATAPSDALPFAAGVVLAGARDGVLFSCFFPGFEPTAGGLGKLSEDSLTLPEVANRRGRVNPGERRVRMSRARRARDERCTPCGRSDTQARMRTFACATRSTARLRAVAATLCSLPALSALSALIVVASGFGAVSTSCAKDENDFAEVEVGRDLVARVTASPLSVAFSYKGRPLTKLAGKGGAPAFALNKDDEILTFGGPLRREGEGAATRIVGKLSDGRSASLAFAVGTEGDVSVTFEVDQKERSELFQTRFAVAEDEAFYGLMERTVSGGSPWDESVKQGLDLRGSRYDMFVTPTVAVYSPFYVSTAGYGVYVQSDWPGKFDMAADERDAVTLRYEGDAITLRVFGGETPIEVTERYARTIGTSILPPKWTFGPWRWRDNVWNHSAFYDRTPYSGPYNSMIVEDFLMMEALGIPCTNYLIDRPWGPGEFGFDDVLWDPKRLPNPEKMVDWVRSKGSNLMLWIVPWATGTMIDEAKRRSLDVKNPSVVTDAPEAPLLDLTNPDAVAFWQDRLVPRIREGVFGFKLDRGEEKVPDGNTFVGTYADGTDYRAGRNAFPTWYAAAARGAFDRAGVKDFVVMPRAAWVGTQKHAIVWGGDTGPTDLGLRSAIIAVQRSAAINFPVWGSDTCGYAYQSNHEVCARWLAFSAFTPLMEVGPTADVAPWSRIPEGHRGRTVDRDGYHYEPVYDESLIAAWIFYANLHNDLVEYTYAQATLAHERGTPIVRPMGMMVPGRPELRDAFEQYFYGPDLLVAPVYKKGQTETRVFIPEGEWGDAWTGQAAPANTAVVVPTPEPKIPIFVRKGSSVKLGDLEARLAAARERAKARPNLAELARTVR